MGAASEVKWKQIFALALAVRILMILWSHFGDYSQQPSGQSRDYFRQGYAIAAGLGFVAGQGAAGDYLDEIQDRVNARILIARPGAVGSPPSGLYPLADHPPGLPLLVAGLHRLFAVPADVPVQVFGALIDASAAVAVAWIGATVTTAATGMAAGVLYGLFIPQAWAATGSQMPDGLIGPFIVFTLAAYLKAIDSHGRRALLWYGIAGLSLAIGSYFRLDYLLLPLAIFPLLWILKRRFAPAAIGSLVVAAVLTLSLLPWAYRNHLQLGHWIFASTGSGANLITSLGEFNNPWGFGPRDLDRLAEARAWGFDSAWDPAAVPHFRRLWLDAVRSHPDAFVMTMVKRLPIALAPPFDTGFNNPLKTHAFTEARAQGRDRYQAILGEPWYVFAAYWDVLLMSVLSATALLASLWWLWVERQRWAVILLVLSPHLYSIAIHMVVHLLPRYIVGSMFVLLVGSAALVGRLWSKRTLAPA